MILFLLALLSQDAAEHARVLADPLYEGRETGTDGERRAAGYIAGVMKRAGLDVRIQPFQGHGTTGHNVIGAAKGASDEAVVVGAHYDHLGAAKDGFYTGADDNASGTGVLLDVAARLARKPARRTVLFIAFSGEEMGLLGSRAYVNAPAVPIEKTVAMVNMDMVGRLRENLIVFGADTGGKFRDYLADSPVPVVHNRDAVGPSDHTSFVLKGVPSVHLFTGAHADYHKPGDTGEKLNVEGMAKIADLVETLVRRIADAPERMAFNKPAAPVAAPKAGKGGTPYLGILPDYGFDGPGVRLAGVSPGSPAEKAGLKEDDVIRELDGKDCADVRAYSAAFFAKQPGDEIALAFDRDGKRQSVKIVLARKAARSDE